MSSLTDQLDELREAVNAAQRRRNVARRAAEREWSTTVEATRPLTDYRDAVLFKKRQPDDDEARRLTRELFERIERDGLVIETAGDRKGLLYVRDPAIQWEVADALAAYHEATRARDAFLRENAAALEKERQAAKDKRFKEAVKDADIEVVREMLKDGPPEKPRRKRVAAGA